MSNSLANCCTGLEVTAPVRIQNRPGLAAIIYRTGDYIRFRDSLLARLSTSGNRLLKNFTTREEDDFTIALLDAWAIVADVLTFYQERIANESYLGTATELLSLTELARLIGYQIRPGVAATAKLVFTLDENAGSSFLMTPSTLPANRSVSSLFVDAGVKVQSVPGVDESPQVFETVEKLEARTEWNRIKVRQTQPQLSVAGTDNILVIKGIDNDVKAGDIILTITSAGKEKKLKKVVQVKLNNDDKTTWLYFDLAASLISYKEPDFTLPAFTPTGTFNGYKSKISLDTGVVNNIISHIWYEKDHAALIQAQGWAEADLQVSYAKALAQKTLTGDPIYVFRKRASIFGYNAAQKIEYDEVEKRTIHNAINTGVTNRLLKDEAGKKIETKASLPDKETTEKIITPVEVPWSIDEKPASIYLDSTYEQIIPGSYIAVRKPGDTLEASTVYQLSDVDVVMRSEYGITMKTTALTILSASPWWGKETKLPAIRDTSVYVAASPLTVADSPIVTDVSGDTIMLDHFYPALKEGKWIVLSGERTDLPGTFSDELKQLDNIYLVDGLTTIKLDSKLIHSYKRSTVAINANIASATHGETVKEVLGSGNAAKTFQKFILKQPPLTFISAATSSGTQSTLEIRVNDILWREVPFLYNCGKSDHVYITRQDDQSRTTITFGDGITGSRLPTGQENIRATYRKGIGSKGLLKANQLSQLLTRPLGVKSVTNPFSTSGAEDKEELSAVRQNAILTVFTLDRIVSLQDYEDFARSFAGIAKSLATWVRIGQKQLVYLTVAGYGGSAVDAASDLYQHLLTAILNNGIPDVQVTLASYHACFFRVDARLLIDPDYIPGKVLEAARQRLSDCYSFANRRFGQGVARSEVISLLQNVEGVLAVDLNWFYRPDKSGALLADFIVANVPGHAGGQLLPAELLTIDLRSDDIQQMI